MGLKLHLGCGDKRIDGYVNIDVRPSEHVCEVADVRTLPKYGPGTVDVIYASHVLEHIGRNEYMAVLSRWHEILAPRGVLRIAVPDIEQVVRHYSEHGDLMVLRGFLWGGQTYKENYHYCGWDYRCMERDLLAVGFSAVGRYDWRQTEHSHIDDFSQCYLPHMDKENGTLMSLNVEAVK